MELRNAELSRFPVAPIIKSYPDLTVEDAYKIQILNIEKKLQEGHIITGKKIGLTSLAVQRMLGVDLPGFGHLTDAMQVQNGIVPTDRLIQPKAEGEIAFLLKEDLKGPCVSAQDVLDATEYVMAAIEIADSRIADWKISIVDTVADNASSGMYIVSDKKVDPRTVDLKEIKMDFYRNGKWMNAGKGSDVLGNPAECVAWLANTLSEFGVTLKKGEVIFSGAVSGMVTAEPGNCFRASFSELGDIELRFE